MSIDPDNLVVQLCAEGMQFEGQARPGDARQAFEKAWALTHSAYERCIAAHYLARHQPSKDTTLEWNLRSLQEADAVREAGEGELVESFYPSLHLNVGHAYEQLGDLTAARAGYRAAEAALPPLPADGENRYGTTVRDAVRRGLERVSALP
jgi:hypothetical protein